MVVLGERFPLVPVRCKKKNKRSAFFSFFHSFPLPVALLGAQREREREREGETEREGWTGMMERGRVWCVYGPVLCDDAVAQGIEGLLWCV